MTERLGAMGAARMIFSLRLASQQFHPGDPEWQICSTLAAQLSGRRGRFGALVDGVGGPDEHLPESVRGNASAIAVQWQRLADVNAGNVGNAAGSGELLPFQEDGLPLECLETWAR